MGVSFDKVDGAMLLEFDMQPATNPTSETQRTAKLVDPGFGRIFTDHMAVVRYNQAKGWHGARVESRANFSLDPATAVLHYAQEIFEGLKAYKRDDGGVNLFRPDANAKRFQNSADRMAMAPLPVPRSSTRAGSGNFNCSAASTSSSVSGRGISVSGVTRNTCEKNSRSPVR